MRQPTHPRMLSALLTEQRNRKQPRKIWLILKGGTLPLVLDTWKLETYDKTFHGYKITPEGETPIFTKGAVVTDYTREGEIRMMVDIDEIVAIKFYEQ
jgi:hypothetical protein